jgi:hypothetical protein
LAHENLNTTSPGVNALLFRFSDLLKKAKVINPMFTGGIYEITHNIAVRVFTLFGSIALKRITGHLGESRR